ncbi:hypothetical protein [Actinoplanes solisilvae]|uniref:hypothetical protein n=1 Tax=Actinoplanes solisilvae TaxID=2486853 RepID=UPI001F0BCFEC|nr:hypothetical protein [Actinoplanes solisilvae]
MFPVEITGTRVALREFRADDLDASMAVVGDPTSPDRSASTYAAEMIKPNA